MEPTLPTQKFVVIERVKEGVIYLKGGSLRQIVIVSGVNFDLKSEAEQVLILNTFQNFINTLDFSVQFFIHSRKVNISNYLEKIEVRRGEETNELLKIQIEEYVNFIKGFVEQNAIITKTFFVVVPYESMAVVGQAKGILGLFERAGGKTRKETALEESLEQLGHRVNQVVDGLGGIGLRTAILNDDELVELFHNMYNPQIVERKNLEIAKK